MHTLSNTITTQATIVCARCECEIDYRQPIFVRVSCEESTAVHQRYSDCVAAVAEADRAAAQTIRDLRSKVMIYAQAGPSE